MSENKVAALLLKRLLIAGVCVLPALSTNVHAAAYAVSSTSITNFKMVLSGISAANFSGGVSSSSIGDTAISDAGNFDSPASCLGCGYSNDFTSHGLYANSSNYSYGDAQIYDPTSAVPLSSISTLNTLMFSGHGAALAIGEAAILNGTADALGSNSLIGKLRVSSGGGSVGFSFDARNTLFADLSSGGQIATANSLMEISISGLTDLSGAPSSYKYKWTCAGMESKALSGSSSVSPSCLTGFSAMPPISLAGGYYSFSVDMQNYVHVESAQPVPVPPAFWLLFSGMAGFLSFARIRK